MISARHSSARCRCRSRIRPSATAARSGRRSGSGGASAADRIMRGACGTGGGWGIGREAGQVLGGAGRGRAAG